MGYIPSEPVFPNITVKQYVSCCAYLRDISTSDALEQLSRNKLSQFEDQKCESLSTGWKKILQLFCLFLYSPTIVMMDEPFNGLDPMFRFDLLQKIEHMKKEGVSFLFSTHILSDLQRIADEITMIRNGEIVFSGPKTADIEKTFNELYVGDTLSFQG